MFATKCPGQDMRYWTADDVHEIECPKCGEPIEFFKTDIRLRCRKCKTRVANPRFDMGCAEWCAYAEQCLGPGAKGLQKKSLKELIEEELEKRAGSSSKITKAIKSAISLAEERCRDEQVDMFPVIAAVTAISLNKAKKIDDPIAFIKEMAIEHAIPEAAIKEAISVVENIGQGHKKSKMEIIAADVLSESAKK